MRIGLSLIKGNWAQAARGEQAAKSHYAHLLGVIEDLTKQLRVSVIHV